MSLNVERLRAGRVLPDPSPRSIPNTPGAELASAVLPRHESGCTVRARTIAKDRAVLHRIFNRAERRGHE